jgi:hypothetical protein
MSLDITLMNQVPVLVEEGTGIFVREDGCTRELTMEEALVRYPDVSIEKEQKPVWSNVVWHGNITHNLAPMAIASGLYRCLWRTDEKDLCNPIAQDIIIPLSDGIERLKSIPNHFTKYNASNGWGTYEQFLSFCEEYLSACRKYPKAIVKVDR